MGTIYKVMKTLKKEPKLKELLEQWRWEYRLAFFPKDNVEKEQPDVIKQIALALNYIIQMEIETYISYLEKSEENNV